MSGSVSEVFRLSHRGKYESLMKQYAGRAAIGHVRYATCGDDDRNYAQPFERHHLQKHKWFSFGFNGQLANYRELRAELLADDDNHLARDNDTEIIMHEISRELSGDRQPPIWSMCCAISPGGSTGRTAWCFSTPWATWWWCAIRWGFGRCAMPKKARCSPRPAKAWRC